LDTINQSTIFTVSYFEFGAKILTCIDGKKVIHFILTIANYAPDNNKKMIKVTSPSGRAGHCICTVGDSLYVFGGDDLKNTDMWRFNMLSSRWVELSSGPSRRIAATLTYYNNCLYIFGGWTGDDVIDDLWEYNIAEDSYLQLTSHGGPPARSNHSTVVIDGSLVVFGGLDYNELLNDVCIYQISKKEWMGVIMTGDVTTRPLPSRCHAAFVHEKSMYVFGGGCETFALSDLWKFSLKTRSWTKIECQHSIFHPSPRLFCVGGTLDGYAYIYGGRFKKDKKKDLWELNLSNFQWKEIVVEDNNAPPVLSGHQGAMLGKSLCIFGGDDGTGKLNNLWVLKVGDVIAIRKFWQNRGNFQDVLITFDANRYC
jgi:hypothetical protein